MGGGKEGGRRRLTRKELLESAAIAAPALLVAADDPYLWDDAALDELKAMGNPHVDIHRIPGSGHCVRRSRTEDFHALVDPWITAHAHA